MRISADHVTLRRLSDRELIEETRRLAARERDATAHVIAALMELDARRLYLGEGCSSLFTYCTQVLRFSEHAAYGRIEAARAARRFPVILDFLTEGSLTLTAIGLLAAHLTLENHSELLASAQHKSKRDIEQIVAALRPLPAAPSSVRKLPVARPIDEPAAVTTGGPLPLEPPRVGAPSTEESVPPMILPSADHECRWTTPPKPAVVTALAPDRYRVQVTISRAAHDKLRRAQDLLRHAIPNGDPAAIVERALTLLVEDLERKKLAAAKRPRAAAPETSHSRDVPAAVKREVWERDEGRCAFIGSAGRCTERGFLEIHHFVPFADGGATDDSNLQLRCRPHNGYEAEAWFGPLICREQAAAYG